MTFTPRKPAAQEMKAFARRQGSLLALPPAPELEARRSRAGAGMCSPDPAAAGGKSMSPALPAHKSERAGPWPSKQNGRGWLPRVDVLRGQR